LSIKNCERKQNQSNQTVEWLKKVEVWAFWAFYLVKQTYIIWQKHFLFIVKCLGIWSGACYKAYNAFDKVNTSLPSKTYFQQSIEGIEGVECWRWLPPIFFHLNNNGYFFSFWINKFHWAMLQSCLLTLFFFSSFLFHPHFASILFFSILQIFCSSLRSFHIFINFFSITFIRSIFFYLNFETYL
jgi:hypothetical protein